jgi:NADH-quinone oxidoreductase subunit C
VSAEELAERIRPRLADTLAARGEVTIVVDRPQLLESLAWLRDEPGVELDFLSSITATDWPGKEPRFWLAYELRSMSRRHRVRVKVGVPAADPRAPSVTASYPTADWHEREIWDFYGIAFDGHPKLTRILLPDDWEGFPLRKDEELGGVDTRFHGGAVHPPIDTRIAP